MCRCRLHHSCRICQTYELPDPENPIPNTTEVRSALLLPSHTHFCTETGVRDSRLYKDGEEAKANAIPAEELKKMEEEPDTDEDETG